MFYPIHIIFRNGRTQQYAIKQRQDSNFNGGPEKFLQELENLMRQLTKKYCKFLFLATQKGVNLQMTDPAAHPLLLKWNKCQRCYKNSIQHFLPRIGDHPKGTVHTVIAKWDAAAKKCWGGCGYSCKFSS